MSTQNPIFPLAQILLWMRKVVNFFIKPTTAKTKTLLQLKELFDTLKKEDRSEDVNFSNILSKTWNDLIEQNLHQKSTALRAFLKEIQTYPKGADHTLGYYLSEYAGQKWLPFPYIELLKKIHLEHLHEPTRSVLTRWTRELDQLISTLYNPSHENSTSQRDL